MPPVHWAAGAKLPGGINPSPTTIYTATAPGQLAGLRTPRFLVGSVRENAGGDVSQRGNRASSGQVSVSNRQ